MRIDDTSALTRRDVAKAAVAGTLLLAGCGGGSSGTGTGDSTPTAPSGPRKRGGTFRLGTSDGATSDSLDPLAAQNTFTNICRCFNLYDRLTEFDHDYKVVPGLATEITPSKDLMSYTVRLRDGVTFHDGKPLTADDVVFTLKRLLDPKNAATTAGTITALDPEKIKKLDKLTVRIGLKFPDVGVPTALAEPGNDIVPVGFDPKRPVGTGPFKLKQFTPGQSSVFVKNPDYWQKGLPYLDELHVVDFADAGTTRVNALSSGQVDGLDHVLTSLIPTVKGIPNVRLVTSPTMAFQNIDMRLDTAPFSDTRVRQAMRLIVDRKQVIEQVFSGYATLGNDLPSFQDPLYAHDIPQRQQDIEQARSLLKQAGHADLRISLAAAEITAGVVETAQVFAQQAKQAGVTVKVDKVADLATYFEKYYLQAPFKFNYNNAFPMFIALGNLYLPKSPYNLSAWKDAEWNRLISQARSEADEAKRKDLLHDAQQIMYDRGPSIIATFQKTNDAYSKKFTGIAQDATAYGLNGLKFRDVSLA